MARRQYHVTIYAVVGEDDRISYWEACTPGSEPVDSDAQVFNMDTDEWERNGGELENGTNKEWIWSKVDSEVEEMIKRTRP